MPCTCALTSTHLQGALHGMKMLYNECACLAHITSIKVVSRRLPHKSLFTIPTLLKSLRRRRSGRHSACRHHNSLPVSLRRLFPSCSKKIRRFFPGFFLFWRIFFLGFWFARILIYADEYCCTYREDVGSSLPLCEGEVDFICQKLICCQFFIFIQILLVINHL